jgi:hypothetical protein
MGPPTVGNDRELIEGSRLLSLLHGHGGHVAIAEIVLCQFLEFTKAYYEVDMMQGSRKTVNDLYRRDVVERYTKIAEFYNAFKTRHSARRYAENGEAAVGAALKKNADVGGAKSFSGGNGLVRRSESIKGTLYH